MKRLLLTVVLFAAGAVLAENTELGGNVLVNATRCYDNVAIGRDTMARAQYSSYNVAIGNGAAEAANSVSKSVFIGDGVASGVSGVANSVYIGNKEGLDALSDTTSINNRQLFISKQGGGIFAINPLQKGVITNAPFFHLNGTNYFNGYVAFRGRTNVDNYPDVPSDTIQFYADAATGEWAINPLRVSPRSQAPVYYDGSKIHFNGLVNFSGISNLANPNKVHFESGWWGIDSVATGSYPYYPSQSRAEIFCTNNVIVMNRPVVFAQGVSGGGANKSAGLSYLSATANYIDVDTWWSIRVRRSGVSPAINCEKLGVGYQIDCHFDSAGNLVRDTTGRIVLNVLTGGGFGTYGYDNKFVQNVTLNGSTNTFNAVLKIPMYYSGSSLVESSYTCTFKFVCATNTITMLHPTFTAESGTWYMTPTEQFPYTLYEADIRQRGTFPTTTYKAVSTKLDEGNDPRGVVVSKHYVENTLLGGCKMELVTSNNTLKVTKGGTAYSVQLTPME